LVPMAYVDSSGDYVVRMSNGVEVQRISSSLPDSVWAENDLKRMFGTCPRANVGGEDCRIVFVHTNQNGLNMALTSSVLDISSREVAMTSSYTPSSTSSGRRLGLVQTDDALYWEPSSSRPLTLETEDNTTIVSPFICITEGEKIVFTFTWYSWPIPVKDAISSWERYDSLDPNDFFGQLHKDLSGATDMASFEKLSTGSTAKGAWRSTLKNTVTRLSTTAGKNPVWTFQHSFLDKGVYTFGSYQRSKSTLSPERFIVVVQPEGSKCGNVISPISTNGDGTDDGTLVMSPDWGLLGGVFGGMLGAVFLTVCLLYYAREHAWGGSGGGVPKYRARNRKMPMARLHQKSSVLTVEEKEAAAKFVTERKMEKPGKKYDTLKVAGPTIPQMMAGMGGADGTIFIHIFCF
jgi:hypothetical protein